MNYHISQRETLFAVCNSLQRTRPERSKPETTDKDRRDFFLETSRNAQQELMVRIDYRDKWLMRQLIGQVILIGFAFGIQFFSVKEDTTHIPSTLMPLFGGPVAFVIALMYSVEDQLIGRIVQWRAKLPETEIKLAGAKCRIPSWETSKELLEYHEENLPHRFWGQIVAFFLIPLYALSIPTSTLVSHLDAVPKLHVVWDLQPHFDDLGYCLLAAALCVDLIFLSLTAAVLWRSYRWRRKSSKELREELKDKPANSDSRSVSMPKSPQQF